MPPVRMLHKFLSTLAHSGKYSTNLTKSTCLNDIFTCPQKKKSNCFVLKVVCPRYTFSLPESGNCYFLVFQNDCPNLTFTCPGQSGKCLCSTLPPVSIVLKMVWTSTGKANLLSSNTTPNHPVLIQPTWKEDRIWSWIYRRNACVQKASLGLGRYNPTPTPMCTCISLSHVTVINKLDWLTYHFICIKILPFLYVLPKIQTKYLTISISNWNIWQCKLEFNITTEIKKNILAKNAPIYAVKPKRH